MSSNPIPILLFSKTSGYRHTSIPASIHALQTLSSQSPLFTLTATESSSAFTPQNLRTYAVIILLQCTGDIFTPSELSALQSFVHNGGGVVSIHAAAAGMPDNEWYANLIGARFDSHPSPERGTFVVEDAQAENFILSGCGGRTGWLDEWYNFTTHPRENGNLKVLLRGDVGSFSGGRHGGDHPLAWCQEFEGGRSFYIALGHFEEAYLEEWFLGVVRRGVVWAAGREGDEGVSVV